MGVVKYGLGASLCKATSSLDSNASLTAWRAELCYVLKTDPQQLIGGLRPAAASSISNMFPKTQVLEAYKRPLSLSSAALAPPEPELAVPSLARIAELCERYFEWGKHETISVKLAKHVWPGIVLRMVLSDILDADKASVSLQAALCVHLTNEMEHTDI